MDTMDKRVDPYPGGERLTRGERDRQQNLTQYIERHIFPADREHIVASARRLHAPDAVISRLERLPAGLYDGFADVWEALHPSESKRWSSS